MLDLLASEYSFFTGLNVFLYLFKKIEIVKVYSIPKHNTQREYRLHYEEYTPALCRSDGIPGAAVSAQSFKGRSVYVLKSQVRSPEQQQCSSFVLLSAADSWSRGDEFRYWEQAPLLQVSQQIWLAAGQMEIVDGNSEETSLLLSFTLYMRSLKVPAFLIFGSQLRMLMTLSDGDQ